MKWNFLLGTFFPKWRRKREENDTKKKNTKSLILFLHSIFNIIFKVSFFPLCQWFLFLPAFFWTRKTVGLKTKALVIVAKNLRRNVRMESCV